MPLDDVWKTFQSSVGIFWKGRFDEVPPTPGVYAWFYPLRVTSFELDEFLREVRRVHLYDARTGREPYAGGINRVGWSSLHWTASLNNPDVRLSDDVRAAWEKLASEPAEFDKLRRVVLRASLLMPPLYVGKAINLRNRSSQHLSGRSDFASRFEHRAGELDLHASRVRDLLLVTLRTEEIGTENTGTERLVEEILKSVAKPPYGVQ